MNGFLTWLGLYIFVVIFHQDKRKSLEINGFIALGFMGLCQIMLSYVPPIISETAGPNSPGSTGAANPVEEPSLGVWEYVGIAVMIGFRFVF